MSNILQALASGNIDLRFAVCKASKKRRFKCGNHRTYARGYYIGSTFMRPKKLRDLADLNGVWETRTWEVVKLVVAPFPALSMWWRAFKRTSVPCQENSSFRVHKLAALAEQNRKNERALKEFTCRMSTSLHSPRVGALQKSTVAGLEAKLVLAAKEIERLKEVNETLGLAIEDKFQLTKFSAG